MYDKRQRALVGSKSNFRLRNDVVRADLVLVCMVASYTLVALHGRINIKLSQSCINKYIISQFRVDARICYSYQELFIHDTSQLTSISDSAKHRETVHSSFRSSRGRHA